MQTPAAHAAGQRVTGSPRLEWRLHRRTPHLAWAGIILNFTTRMFDLTTAAVIYCVLVGLTFLGLWLWYDRRDHRRFELERRRTTFHCIRCDALYTAPTGTELCKCPKCGHENARLRF